VTARREFGGAIAACVVGAGLVLLALRQHWARVDFHAPPPLPSGSVPVTGQGLMPAAAALALAALACLAAIIATRGVLRRAAGVLLAGLGVWIAVMVSEPVRAASVIAAAAGAGSPGGYAGSVAGGNSAIAGNATTGNGLPVLGTATKVALDSAPWRAAAVAGAVLLIAAGLFAAWRGPRWPVMSARFDRPGQPATRPAGPPAAAPSATAEQALTSTPGSTEPGSTEPGSTETEQLHPDGDTAALWEALDRGVDLTDTTSPGAPAEPGATASPDATAEPVAAGGDEQ
jgi:Tryptophan-associated transmembrane protein (Trp_oprn_chp)